MADAEETADDYDAKAAELTQQAKETKDAQEEAHAAMLDAVAEGEEFQIEDYEWVELGSAELKVKTWYPGDLLNNVADRQEEVSKDGGDSVRQYIELNIDILTSQTEVVRAAGSEWTEKAQIRSFFEKFFERFGLTGIERAIDRVSAPVSDNSDEEDVMKSFRST